MSPEIQDLLALVERNHVLAEEVRMMYRQQLKAAEALIIQLLLSNGKSLPLIDSLWEEAANGAWELHWDGGRMWLEGVRNE